MAYYNHKKESQLGNQIKWKNTTHDAKFNPEKKFYSVIKVGDTSFLSEYVTKFRSEALAIFNEEARLMGGKLENIGVYR